MKVDPLIINNDPFFDIELTTTNYVSYDLTIKNKTHEDVEIVWDKTQYIDEKNSPSGGFMFGNESYSEDKDTPKNPTIVFADDSSTKTIYPTPLAYWHWRNGWNHDWLPRGKSGVYLTLRSNGEEIKHRLYVNISY